MSAAVAGGVAHDPALVVAVALVVGMLAQAAAVHLRLPGIVLLLAAGLLLGPDVLGVVDPDSLGPALQMLVGYAVAIILFEGGLNLNLRQLGREARSIRQLVTVGAAVTAAGGACAARLLLGWDWSRSILFGTLVIVTGPTVITPLLRRIRVKRKLATVLEAEGVFGDAIGAIVAVVALEVVLRPSAESLAEGFGQLLARLGGGAIVGLAGGALLAVVLRREELIPKGLENVFTLSFVLVLFQLGNALLEESGIVAVTVAGLTVGNIRTPVVEELRDFKEQLTMLFIGMLFVLLAADVRLSEVSALGRNGLLTVAALMFVVRPLNVLVGTLGTQFTLRERAFLSWLAPRGIVAAAVSSLFALRLEAAGFSGGGELRALVFLVIAVTVVVEGLTGGWVASLLGVRRPAEGGVAILGANALGRALAAQLEGGDTRVVLVDSSPQACTAAEKEGFRVVYGSAFSEAVLMRAGLDERDGCVAVTNNEEVNFAFCRRARREFRTGRVWVALRTESTEVTPAMVEHMGGRVLFGGPRNFERWTIRLEAKQAEVESWRSIEDSDSREALTVDDLLRDVGTALALAVVRDGKVRLVDEQTLLGAGDELRLLVLVSAREDLASMLQAQGWERVKAEGAVG